MDARTHIFHQDPVLQLCACDDVFVERWSGPGDADRLQILIRHHMAYLEGRAPAKSLTLAHVASERMHLPDARTRGLIQEHIVLTEPYVAASALVLTAGGFGASVIRGILSAATLARRTGHPHRVFGGVDEAIVWLVDHRARRSTVLPDAAATIDWYRATDGEMGPM